MDAVNVSTIICVDCGAELEPSVETCRHCGGPIAMQRALEPNARVKQLLDRPWVLVVLMLHVGLLGIPVYWQTKYSLGVRLSLVIASIVYTVGAVVAIVVMLQRLLHLLIGS